MKIIELMKQDSRITTVRLSEIIGISKRNIEANISDLKKKGMKSFKKYGATPPTINKTIEMISFKNQ
ncbi:MAG: winged helix-turn-helix transcriptional regulator [Clostridiales bacterium]|jgi:predicted HTH transcriptional regulator|nr:winged helix-turn-helix transcriptional regulator [Eubacteriales bacterium]MDH7567314.1 winged helix-turn-helix transcriptional regulator [Clostridiales bacterium]